MSAVIVAEELTKRYGPRLAVDHVDGNRIKLTKADSSAQLQQGEGEGQHSGHHHYISLGLVAGVEGDKVRLSATGANAVTFEEEEGDQ